MNFKESLRSMESGECRWIGREDVHVYCKAPQQMLPLYAVVCPAADRRECRDWMTDSQAAALIEKILGEIGGRP